MSGDVVISGNGEHGVSVISVVDIADELPNGDDSAFAEDPQSSETLQHHHSRHPTDIADCIVQTTDGTTHYQHPDGTITTGEAVPVYVATSQGLLTPEQLQEAGIKTTHIVIHDQSLTIHDQSLTIDSGLKTPNTPLPPPTPATPLSKGKGFRFQWDDSVHSPVLPVRCKNSNGELYKDKFGSGGRGKCIYVRTENVWYTPNEFEAISGRASSKDWKRSIRYGGRTLQCLIEDEILHPHATSCTCASCCDDEAVTGPVRLFVPYRRRRREEGESLGGEPQSPTLKKMRNIPSKSPATTTMIPANLANLPKDAVQVVSISGTNPLTLSHPLTVHSEPMTETVQIVTQDAAGNIISGDAVIMTPLPMTPKPLNNIMLPMTVGLDVSEQKQWWQLEEMANSLIQQAQQLKMLIDQARHQSAASKEIALQNLRLQVEKDKRDVVNAARIESQMSVSRAIMEERAHKDIAVQQALAQARAEMQDKIESVSVVTLAQARAEMQDKIESVSVVTDDQEKAYKVTYNVAWQHNDGTTTTMDDIQTITMDGEVVETALVETLVEKEKD